MFKKLLKFSAIISLPVAIISCTNTNNKPIIKFAADSSSIIIKNIDATSLLQAKNAFTNDTNGTNLVSVVVLPGELDSLQDQLTVHGKYLFKEDSLIFTPDIPFQKNKSYLVENFINVKFANTGKLFSGTINYNLKPQKQILQR